MSSWVLLGLPPTHALLPLVPAWPTLTLQFSAQSPAENTFLALPPPPCVLASALCSPHLRLHEARIPAHSACLWNHVSALPGHAFWGQRPGDSYHCRASVSSTVPRHNRQSAHSCGMDEGVSISFKLQAFLIYFISQLSDKPTVVQIQMF